MAQTAPRYTVQLFDMVEYPELLNFSSLNNRGEIIGTVYPTAFVYKGGAFLYLELPPSITNRTSLNAINNASQIVGNDSAGNAFLYKDAEQFWDFGPPVYRPAALDINDRGQVLARGAVGGDMHTLLYQDGGVTDLGPGYPNKLNRRGEINGARGSFVGDAFLYTHGLTLDLGALAGPNTQSAGIAIDSSGRALVFVQRNLEYNYTYLYMGGKLQPLAGGAQP